MAPDPVPGPSTLGRDLACLVGGLVAAVDVAFVLTHSRAAPALGLVAWSGWGLAALLALHVFLLGNLVPVPELSRLADAVRRAGELLLARWVLTGVAAGFLTCCVAGRTLERELVLDPFQRFHAHLGPGAFYQPTAPQLLELGRRRLPPDKVGVLIGGSSVLNGAGQRPGHVWSEALARRLGDRFAVLNVAPRGGPATGYGLITARMLLPERPRLIYLCDLWPGAEGVSVVPDGGALFRHALVDAETRGLLPPSATVTEQLDRWTAEQPDEGRRELALRCRLDRPARFTDLWSTVGWRALFTVWTPETGFTPRQAVVDPGDPVLPLAQRFRGRYPDDLEIIRGQVALMGRTTTWEKARASLDASIPAELRPRTLCVVNAFNPYHVAAVAAGLPDALPRYLRARVEARAHLEAWGLRATTPSLSASTEEFADLWHYTEAGGEGLAAELAPELVRMAHELGYLAP